MAAVVALQGNRVGAQALGPNQIAPQRNELADRILTAAFAALRYTALIAIASSSAYFLGQNFLGRCAIGLLSGVTLVVGASYATNSIFKIGNREIFHEEVAKRADTAARVVLWSLLIVGALTAGFAGGYVLSGANFLLAGSGDVLSILNGLVDITFTFGYAIPFAQLLLRNSNFLYAGYQQLTDRLADVIREFQNQPQLLAREPHLRVQEQMGRILGRFAFFFGDEINFDRLLEVAEHVPEEYLRNQFLFNLPHLSNERVDQIIFRFKNTFSIEFLANQMPEDRFRQVVLPKLVSPMNGVELENIAVDIERKDLRIGELEQMVLQNGNVAQLQREVGLISAGLAQNRNNILKLQEFIRRLPQQPLPERYRDQQAEIDRARALQQRVLQISERLNRGEIWNRLQRISSQLAVQEEIDNSDDPNYEVLGALGFSIRHFRALGAQLGIPAEELGNREIERTSQFLDAMGLSDRAAIIRNRILEVIEVGGHPPTPEEITQRIVNFYQQNGVALPPLRNQVQPVDAAPAQAPLENLIAYPRLVAAARLVHDLFYATLSTSLIAFQVVAQPISTLVGFSARIAFPSQRVDVDRLFLIHRLPPNYIHQSFTERMRQLYLRISTVAWSLSFGSIGGFFMGIAHGTASLYYSRQLYQRIRLLRA